MKKYLQVLLLILFMSLLIFPSEDKEPVSENEKLEKYEEENLEAIKENDEADDTETEEMPKITDIITGKTYAVALCEDGGVWYQEYTQDDSQETGYQTGSFKKIDGLEHIMKIMVVKSTEIDDPIPTVYALSSDGYIYAWGSNRRGMIDPVEKGSMSYEKYDVIFNKPILVEGISDVTEMDAKNGKAFAIDEEGRLYAWGWAVPLSGNGWDDMKPEWLPEEGWKAIGNVKEMFIGAGEYHYFIRGDGSIFSIMDLYYYDLSYVYPYIFPDLSIMGEQTDLSYEEKYTSSLLLPEPAVQIDEGSKFGITVLYEMGSDADIDQITADNYTMFMVKKDGTLWYWNSDRIKYHDRKAAMVDASNGAINFGGKYIEVDYLGLLGHGENGIGDQRIIDLCAGEENALFLTDSGQVFISKYITTEIKDVEYYDRSTTNPWRTYFTMVEYGMHLKSLSFEKLDYENIARINTDGGYHFSLLDKEGNYFNLDMSDEYLEK